MALDVSSLANELARIFKSHPESPADAGVKIATAYYAYAQTALFGASLPVLVTAYRDAMAATLAAAFAVPGLPPIAANAFGSALTVFWSAVVVTGAQTGTSNGCPGAASVPAALLPVFLVPDATEEVAGMGVANALHTATLTVTATVSPPPGTILPIS